MMTNLVRLVMTVVLLGYALVALMMLTGCGVDPTGPSASRAPVAGVPGHVAILVCFTGDSLTTLLTGLPPCPR